MLSAFNDRLQNNYSDLLEDTELSPGENMLKTAVVESNIPPLEVFEKEEVDRVREVDQNLHLFKWTTGNSGSDWFFLDTHDKRFWIFYSLSKSNFFGDAMREIVTSEGAGLDRLWLPRGQIERIGEMGAYEGVKISYGANDVFPEEFIKENLEFSDLNIDGSGSSSKNLYEILKQTEKLDPFLALSRIQIRREIDGDFVRERVTNEGMFTTRGGTNIRLHISTVEQIKEQYAQMLNAIESNHIIGATSREHGARPQGAPIIIKFSREVHDVEEFLSYIVNAKNPFRLWGHTRKISASAYKVDGVDMHNGDKIAIEMAPDWMRLYLYDGACGNTALRLFTNLQQYYDPAAELIYHNNNSHTR
ncbi:hypothetical protein [Natronocalculus amylovorans]|uniref:Uncharacterized protein n=1 Tax=Natronocalculus amylovorans TaxID=2917812 RepID=A0AAE3G0L3_9EURY|nr:hypothetical protein [Natronocalculus amylovorans]MCL9818373.1 hypothetical protein [Natronocalculus amylovorans]